MKYIVYTCYTFSIFVQITIYLSMGSMGICKKLHLNKIEKQDGYINQNHTNYSIASSALNISEELFFKAFQSLSTRCGKSHACIVLLNGELELLLNSQTENCIQQSCRV